LSPITKSFEVELTDEGKKDSLLLGLKAKLPVFQLHGETVKLTPEMKLLGIGKHCRHQIVRVGKTAYGIQCHFELTRAMMLLWQEKDRDLSRIPKKTLLHQFMAIEKVYIRDGLRLIENFFEIAGILAPQTIIPSSS